MELIQEIGSYAGLAAILGLAVLSALYFSQARDVRRLRDWAGRAPERTTEPAAQPTRVVARPVPRPPGATGTQTGLRPVGGAAATSAAGAAPAVATGPAAATPAAARVSGAATGPEEGEGVSQDTMAHPPPAHDSNGDGDDPGFDEVDGQRTDDSPHAVEDYEPEDEDEDEDELDVAGEEDQLHDDELEDEDEPEATGTPPPEEHWEDDASEEDDTGDRPVVAAPPTPPPARPIPSPPRPPVMPSRAAPATPAGARPAAAASSRGGPQTGPGILPPYERSRPGGDPWYRRVFYSPGRAAIVIGLAVLVLAAATLAGLRLAGGDDEPATQATEQPAGQAADNGDDSGQGGSDPRPAIDPADVTVSVLNGTTVTGLASNVGDTVEAEGYQLGTVTNSTDQTRAESVVFYAEGAEAEAEDVSRRLDIPQREPIDADTQAIAGDARVVVVIGADKS